MTNRIREVRKALGLTLEEVAQRIGTTNQQVHRLEKEQRRLTVEWLERLASAFNCDPTDLLPDWVASPINIIGSAGPNGQVTIFQRERGETEPPPRQMGELVAITVRGDALLPRYGDGDLIFYRPAQNDQKDVFLGNECVEAVLDGRIFLRKVLEGSRRLLFTLVAPNAVEMTNASVQWAEPVRWVKRAVGKS